MSAHVSSLIQQRKAESVSLATQVSPATPVPSLPGLAEASQASVYPAVRDTNTFNLKSNARDDHEQLTSLTTVNQHLITLRSSNDQSLVSHYYSVGVWFLISPLFKWSQNGTARRPMPNQPGRKRKQPPNCGGTDEVWNTLGIMGIASLTKSLFALISTVDLRICSHQSHL